MPTVAQFTSEQRSLLSDPAGPGQSWSDVDLSVYRDKSFRDLYKNYIAKEVSNYTTTYTDMPLAITTTLDYAMPAGWQRVVDVSYWTNETNTLYVARSGMWDDRERDGYIRIFDGPDYYNYRIQLRGLKKWTGIDDSSMPDEVYDAVLLGSIYYAVKALVNKRAALRRQATSQDNALGSEALWYRTVSADYRDALKKARRAMVVIGR